MMPSRSFAVLIFCLLLVQVPLQAQTDGEAGAPSRVRSTRSLRPILAEIVIQGNTSVSETDILAVIRSRATSSSNLERYARIAFPLSVRLAAFLKRKAGEESEFRYLNTATLQEDTIAIAALYDDRGFHDARVRVRYTVDTARNLARLYFQIAEGPRYNIWGVRFVGLSGVPEELRTQAENLQSLQPGQPFDVLNVDQEVSRIITLLQNNGYPFAAESRIPDVPVCRSCTEPLDSVIIYITPGSRYRIGTTAVLPIDSVTKAPPVDTSLIRSRLRYHPGEWYNRSAVDDSRRDLYRLGIFELVTIDTAAINGDTINMEVDYNLNDQYEFESSLELSLSPRADETVFGAGVSARFTRHNIFRRAIRGTVGGRGQTRLFTFDEAQWGLDGRLDVPAPLLIPSDVVSFSAGIARGVDDREADVGLVSRRFSFGTDLGWNFPSSFIVSGISARLFFQNTSYANVAEYIRAKAETRLAEVALPDSCDKDLLVEQIIPALARDIYRVQVLQGDSPELKPSQAARDQGSALQQTLVIGTSVVGDHRNDFFSPTKGYYLEGRVDVGFTGAFAGVVGGFIKGEIDYRRYMSAGGRNVWAFRLHGGAIGQFGEFPLTPIGSRFHAGGANSIRGWGARDMLVTSPPADFAGTCADTVLREILDESRRLLGGLWLIEGSVEYRMRLGERFVLIPFIDAGNAYFRNYSDDRELITLNTFIEYLGLATGLNIGIETPAGPIRFGVGFPVYNPLDYQGQDRWVWNHSLDLAYQLSIGYAF